MMKPAFVSYHDAVKKVVALDSIPFKQLWWNFLLKFVHLCLQQVTHQAQTLHLFPDCTVPYFNPRCHFPDLHIIFFWWTPRLYPLFFLVEAVHGEPLWGLSLMSVPVFKVVYHCLTLLVPMQASPYAHWSCVWMSDGCISPSAHNSVTARCMSLPVIFLHRNMTIRHWGRQRDFSWFQTFAVFWMLYYFFWVIPHCLNFVCQHFGTPSLFHLHTYPPMKMEHTECSKTLEYKIQMPGSYPEESIQQHDFYSGMSHWLEVVIIYSALKYCMIFVYNYMMLITFCTTFIHITPHKRMWYIRNVQSFWICYD